MKKLIITFIIIVVFAFFVNLYINNVLNAVDQDEINKNQMKVVAKAPEKKKKVVRDSEYERALAEKMAKKGVVIIPPGEEPRTEEQWEYRMRHDMDRFKVLEGENATQAISEMELSQEEYRKNMDTLEEHIGIVKEEIKSDPFNEDKQVLLQNLYQIKAVGNILKDKVITGPEAMLPDTEIVPQQP